MVESIDRMFETTMVVEKKMIFKTYEQLLNKQLEYFRSRDIVTNTTQANMVNAIKSV